MCGITGFVGGGKTEDLQRMNSVIRHRGPDENGYVADTKSRIFLAHSRLAIIDIADGSQPMWNADKNMCVVFNGEIYNHLELRTELKAKGYVFKTDHSDTETLLHGYAEWGESMPEKLNGMWAFAIWDKNNKKLFLSRDRFGQKPLFYTSNSEFFAFSSELKSLVQHGGITPNISNLSLKKYFAYGFIPSPCTIYEDIFKLPGGCNLTLDLTNMKIRKNTYWEFSVDPFDELPKNPITEWGEQLLELLDRAVKRRLMSDVPIGTFLSGGIDSTAIAYFAAKNTSRPINTFAIGFEEPSFDESKFAQMAAEYIGTKHDTTILSINKALEMLPNILEKLDEPLGDSSLIPCWLLSHNTAKHVKVALSGDGGDELFAGYDPFRALKVARIYNRLMPKKLHEGISMLLSHAPVSHANMSLDFKLKRSLRGLSYPKKFWNPVWLGTLTTQEINDLVLSSPTEIEELYSEALICWERCKSKHLVDKTLEFYTKMYLQDDILIKVDRASMLNSLETRSPFLDIELVDFVRRIPHSYKYRNGTTKFILKKSLEKVIPKEIVYRKKKGFGMPVGKWLADDKLKLDLNSLPKCVNKASCQDLLTQHCTGKTDQRQALWNLITLQHNSAKPE